MMNNPRHDPSEADEYARRKRTNIIAGIAILALLAAFYVVIDQVIASNKAQLCVESGGRKCRQIETR